MKIWPNSYDFLLNSYEFWRQGPFLSYLSNETILSHSSLERMKIYMNMNEDEPENRPIGASNLP